MATGIRQAGWKVALLPSGRIVYDLGKRKHKKRIPIEGIPLFHQVIQLLIIDQLLSYVKSQFVVAF